MNADNSHSSVPQQYSNRMPMVVVAQAEPSAARGFTGWFVLVIITLSAAVTLLFAWHNWIKEDSLASQAERQRELRSDISALTRYRQELDVQNNQLRTFYARRIVLSQAELANLDLEVPDLQREVDREKRDFDRLRERNLGYQCRRSPQTDGCDQWRRRQAAASSANARNTSQPRRNPAERR